MPRHLFTPGHLTFALFCAAIAARVGAAEDPGSFFDREVKPVLAEHCFKCHGPEKQKGGLRLDAKALMLGGGDSGDPAIVAGDSAESPLVARVNSTDPDEMMPPKGERLNAGQIATLRRWIDDGAHWPGSSEVEENEEIASAPGMSITDVDRAFWAFQRPQRHNVPSGEQSEWARQPIDHFILAKLREHGLEPSPEESRAVLLRRLSLDLTGLPPTPDEADAFLSDTAPDALDRAADRLLSSPRFGEHLASLWLPLARYAEDQAHQVGDDTKFFYPNAWRYRAWVIAAFNRDLPYDQFLRLQLAADQMDSATPGDLAALGFLGLGPKYYDRGKIAVQADEWEDRVDTVTRTMLGLTVACARCHDHKFDPISTRDYYALAGVFASTRMVNRRPDGSDEKENAKAAEMNPEVLHVVADAEPRDLRVFIRGNPERQGAKVGRRFLEILAPPAASAFSKDASGRRELAECIASDRNPLAARVFINRVWARLLGRPLVATPSNFGHSGALPNHPELLDDLAARFMENGWSVKQLVREIVLSSVYRQSTAMDTGKVALDPENVWLWRMNRRRLTIEQWRDTALFVAGELREEPGGKSEDIDEPTTRGRTLYARISRLKLADTLMQFDYPDANVHAEKRTVTTTPIQKLFMMNSPFMQRMASSLAARLLGGAEDDTTRVTNAYRLLFTREPDETERDLALTFLRKTAASDLSRWEQYAQLLLASNELLYVD